MHNSLVKVLLVFLLSFFTKFAFSQANTNEPYTRFGYGILQPNYFGQSRGMGGVSAALREENLINIANPASYSAIRITTLESGLQLKFISLRAFNSKETSFNGQFSYLAMGFPLSPRWSMVLAIVPYSNIGYKQVLDNIIPVLGPQKAIYSGEGGLTQAFMGHGFTIAKGLSIGFNAGYVFGNIESSQSTVFLNDTVYNARISSTQQLGGFNFEYGAQYNFRTNKDSKFTVGYDGAYGNAIITREKLFTDRFTSNIRGNERSLDTITSKAQPPKASFLPTKNSLGISYKFQNKLLLATEINYDIYSSVVYNGLNAGFRDAWRVAVGGQYTPDITSVSNYWDLVDYRAGISYGKTNLRIHQQDIDQYALTFGLGLPLRSYTQSQVSSKINIGFEIGQLGSVTAANVLQKYFNVHIGFVLNQLWFNRYRYQ